MKILSAALALHSSRYSSKAFIEGPDGLPTPNLARMERDPHVCFVDPPPGDPPAPPPKTYTQQEVDAINAKTSSKLEAKLKAESDAAIAAMRGELDAMKGQIEEAGKSEKEKAEIRAAKERAAIEAKLGESEKALAEKDAKATAAAIKLRDATTTYELQAHAAKAKVLPEATRAALLVFRADATIEYDADDNVTGVDIGTKRFPTLAEAFADWIKDNGAIYQAAPAGGANTRPGNASGAGVPHMKKTTEQLIAEGDALRARRP